MKKKICLSFCVVAVVCLSSFTGSSAAPIQVNRVAQITKLEGDSYSQSFGRSVAIQGSILAVGDPYDNQLGEQVGAVTIFQEDAEGKWMKTAYLSPSVVVEGMRFGRSIALSGNRLVVGAPANSNINYQPGSAYVFEQDELEPDTWNEVARLTNGDAEFDDNYGWAVGISGDTAVIGAYSRPIGGRVFIYEQDEGGSGSWGETTQLYPDGPGFQACFGESLELDGDLLAVGAYGGGDYSGYVYVFQRTPATNQWQRLTRFRAADTYAYHYFGYSVALDGWTILAGAPGADSVAGAAYIFTADPLQPEIWIERKKLSASDGAMLDYFGYAVDLSGEHAWVGAPMHADQAGSAYLFGRDHPEPDFWGEISPVIGNDTQAGDVFSEWTAIDGNLAVAGAPGSPPTGAVYLFDVNQPWRILLPLLFR